LQRRHRSSASSQWWRPRLVTKHTAGASGSMSSESLCASWKSDAERALSHAGHSGKSGPRAGGARRFGRCRGNSTFSRVNLPGVPKRRYEGRGKP
jgi:hypothetical protein